MQNPTYKTVSALSPQVSVAPVSLRIAPSKIKFANQGVAVAKRQTDLMPLQQPPPMQHLQVPNVRMQLDDRTDY